MAGDWMLGIPAYEKHVADQFDFQIFVRKADGVGLAAPQIGVSLRIAVIETRPTETRPSLKQKGPVTVPREFVFMDRAAIGLGATLALVCAQRFRVRIGNIQFLFYRLVGGWVGGDVLNEFPSFGENIRSHGHC